MGLFGGNKNKNRRQMLYDDWEKLQELSDGGEGYEEDEGDYSAEEYEPQYAAEEYEEPQYTAEAYDEPQYTAEANEEPQYAAEAYDEPQYAAEEYEEPQYAAEAYDEPQYTAEAYDEPQYAADTYSESEYDGDEYGYEQEFEEQEEDELYLIGETSNFGGARHKGKKKGANNLWGGSAGMSVLDKVITGTGIALLLIVLVIGVVFIGNRMLDRSMEALAEMGSQLDLVTLPGEKGLLAIADAQAAKKAAAEELARLEQERLEAEKEEKEKEYQEQDYVNAVTVKMNLSSIQKDLKIKFVNQETGKLVSNVPFSVTVTDPDKDTMTWKDDDMDGIIYKTELTPGKYIVLAEPFTAEKYQNYTVPSQPDTIEVKKDIEYKKVDITDEIKTESEVNVAVEDTKKNETQVESKLEDTVQWVESTTTVQKYQKVDKSTIANPMTLASTAGFRRLAQMTAYTSQISASSQTLKAGESFILTATSADVSLTDVTWNASPEGVVELSGNGAQITVKALKAGSAVVTYLANGTAVSGGNAVNGLQGSCQVTVQSGLTKGTVTVSQQGVSLTPGISTAVQLSVSGYTAGQELSYSVKSASDAIAKASYDGSGNVVITGVAKGETIIDITVNYKNQAMAAYEAKTSVKVTVTDAAKLSLDKSTATVYVGTPVVLKATLANAAATAVITAGSSDQQIATVAVSGRDVTVTGVKAGSATITVYYKENGNDLKAACTVTVKPDPATDKTNKLKDVNGNQIYVLESGNYREAFYADYYTATDFYIKGEAKYTGWQTIDGKIFYFDANGQKVTGTQVIQGAMYEFGTDGALNDGSARRGIDVSKWNGNIDWAAVKNSGIEYVIIRCGYRGSSQGMLIEDPKFKSNISGASKAGLKVGVYFFTQAISEAEAVEEASMVLEQIKGYSISYPVFLDVEPSGGRADGISKATRTAVCKAFCQTIQSGGYTAGIYANKNWFTEKIDASALSAYKIWLAQYAATPTYTGRYDLWQFSSTGKVSGISGDVDMNWSYLGY